MSYNDDDDELCYRCPNFPIYIQIQVHTSSFFMLILADHYIKLNFGTKFKKSKIEFFSQCAHFFLLSLAWQFAFFYFTVFPVIINNLIPLFPVWTAEWVVAALIFLSFSVVLSCNVKKKIARIFLLFLLLVFFSNFSANNVSKLLFSFIFAVQFSSF